MTQRPVPAGLHRPASRAGCEYHSRPDGGGKDSGPKSTSEYGVRFGFRELEAGRRPLRAQRREGQLQRRQPSGRQLRQHRPPRRSDAYDTLPGFLEPSEATADGPRRCDNYLRLNYNGVRIHQLPATPYMLDVADELGLMIQDETAIRGSNNRENFVTGRDNMVKHLADLVGRDRNHASVLRWSQANEPRMPFFVNPGAGPSSTRRSTRR